MSVNPLQILLQPLPITIGQILGVLPKDPYAIPAPTPTGLDSVLEPLGINAENAPIAALGIGVIGTVGAAYIADKISNQRITIEHWENKASPGTLERFRKEFSGARTGLKSWYKRHEKDLASIAGLLLLGGLMAAGQKVQPLELPQPEPATPYLPAYIPGGTPGAGGAWISA